MATDCFKTLLKEETLKKIFGEERYKDIPPKLVKEWLAGADRIKEAFDRGEIPKVEMNRRLDEELGKFKISAEIRDILKVADVNAQARVTKFVRAESYGGKEAEGFRAYLTKTFLRGNNARTGVETKIRARLTHYSDMLSEGLKANKLVEVFNSGALDEEVHIAHHSLVTGGKPDVAISKEAMKIAEIIRDTNDIMFKDMTDVRMPVQYKKSRVSLQTHDPKKLRAMGKEKWVALVKELNPDRSYLGTEALTNEGLEKVLGDMFDDILIGKHSEIDIDGNLSHVSDGDAPSGTVGSSKISKRNLNFGPKETFRYNKEAGVYGTLQQTLVADIVKTANKTSLFEALGDKPKENWNKAITLEVARLKKEGKIPESEKLEGSRRNLNDQLARIMKTTNVPGSEAIANVERIIAGAEVTSKLGNTGFRAISNFANLISVARTATGEGYFKALTSSVMALDFKDAKVKTFSKDMGEIFQNMVQDMNASVRGDGAVGLMTKMANFTMKYNGQNYLNHLFANGITMKVQGDWGKNLVSGKSFDTLPAHMRSDLLSFGVDKADWENIFVHTVREASNGKSYMTVEGFDPKNPAALEGAKKVMALKGLKTTPEKYLKDLKLNTLSYFEQLSDIATTTPGAREQAALLSDSQTGTMDGAARSIAMRFKSFSAQAVHTTRSFLNSNVDEDALSRGVAKSKGTNYAFTAQWVMTGIGLSYMADTLIRIGQGKEPKDPNDVWTYVDALAKSSAGGMYLDMFNNEWDKYSGAQTLVGPTFGQVEPLYSAVSHIRKGEITKGERGNAIEDVTKIVRSYMPFQQAVLTKQAYDHVQFRVIKEALNPDSNPRYDAKQAREKLKRRLEENR